MKTPIFTGSCTALITPFHDGAPDLQRWGENLDFQYDNGTAAVVVNATTGENATLSPEESMELLRSTVLAVKGKMKIIAGIGSNNTLTALKNAEYAKAVGADAVLMVTPYYNKASQRGLIEHFSYVADRVDLPMILYNVPGRTGIGLKAETYRVLSEHPRINGVKEASGDISLVAETRSLCGEELCIYSGNDDQTVAMIALGAFGVISVASNLIPAAVAKLCTLALEGDFEAATALNNRYAPLFAALFTEPNPIPVKAAMKLLDMDSGELRLPLTEIGEAAMKRLRAAMKGAGLAG